MKGRRSRLPSKISYSPFPAAKYPHPISQITTARHTNIAPKLINCKTDCLFSFNIIQHVKQDNHWDWQSFSISFPTNHQYTAALYCMLCAPLQFPLCKMLAVRRSLDKLCCCCFICSSYSVDSSGSLPSLRDAPSEYTHIQTKCQDNRTNYDVKCNAFVSFEHVEARP